MGVLAKIGSAAKVSVLRKARKEAQEKAGEYNSLVFLMATVMAMVADGLDMIPVPIVDLVFSLAPKGLVAYLIFQQLGWKRQVVKKIIQIAAVLILDSLFALIPFIDIVTPITTLLVLYSWHVAKKRSEKAERKAKSLEQQENKIKSSF